MVNLFAWCKKAFSDSKKAQDQDISNVMKRVDAQVGRAVTRLSER